MSDDKDQIPTSGPVAPVHGTGTDLTAAGGHGAVPISGVPVPEPEPSDATGHDVGLRKGWPLWEVFIRARRGLSHQHVGSLHAPDAAMALRNARDVYTRRGEGVSIWVVPSAAIVASDPADKDALFEPALDKVYRHPTFYEIPDGVGNI